MKMTNFSPVIFQMENILLDERGKSFSFPSPFSVGVCHG